MPRKAALASSIVNSLAPPRPGFPLDAIVVTPCINMIGISRPFASGQTVTNRASRIFTARGEGVCGLPGSPGIPIGPPDCPIHVKGFDETGALNKTNFFANERERSARAAPSRSVMSTTTARSTSSRVPDNRRAGFGEFG